LAHRTRAPSARPTFGAISRPAPGLRLGRERMLPAGGLVRAPRVCSDDGLLVSSLEDIDDAFLRLRRLWASSRQGILNDHAPAVELSSLLVVETCARCEERDQEANVSHVAFLADVTASTASRLVDTAERAGLLVRAPSRHSARQTALQLTDAGRALRARAVAHRQGWLAESCSIGTGATSTASPSSCNASPTSCTTDPSCRHPSAWSVRGCLRRHRESRDGLSQRWAQRTDWVVGAAGRGADEPSTQPDVLVLRLGLEQRERLLTRAADHRHRSPWLIPAGDVMTSWIPQRGGVRHGMEERAWVRRGLTQGRW
jgi:DNA-binding MarR family transcriptional regulator